MRIKSFVVGALSVFLAFNNAQAGSEDVYVDLSVLNNLGNSSGYIDQGPKFPIVKKTPIVKRKESKIIEKAPVSVVQKEEVVVIPEKAPDVQPEPIVQETVVKEEPKVSEPAPVVGEAPSTSVEVAPVTEVVPSTETVVTSEIEDNHAISESPSPELSTNIQKVTGTSDSGKQITFDNGGTDLSEANKQAVDAIVSAFTNPNSKIGIFAYNYDDGVDSFKKKRDSLNRAIEVRSYLLGKGYKNFSIKVINTTDDASKNNVVEFNEQM